MKAVLLILLLLLLALVPLSAHADLDPVPLMTRQFGAPVPLQLGYYCTPDYVSCVIPQASDFTLGGAFYIEPFYQGVAGNGAFLVTPSSVNFTAYGANETYSGKASFYNVGPCWFYLGNGTYEYVYLAEWGVNLPSMQAPSVANPILVNIQGFTTAYGGKNLTASINFLLFVG